MPAQGQAKRRSLTQEPTAGKPPKRTRVSRACDQCRVAREKCDGAQPSCSTCLTAKRGCTYTTNPKKRGIQPGYIRVLELALALLFQQNPENEKALNGVLAKDAASSILMSRDSKDSNKLHKQWRKSRFCRDVDTLLSGGEPPRYDPGQDSPGDDDESEMEDIGTVSAVPDIPDTDFQPISLDTETSHPLQIDPPAPILQPSDSTLVSLPTDTWRLFETYFTYTQCWLPVCEKHDILKLSYAYPAQGLQLSAELSDSGAHAELWSVLAVASIHNINSASPTQQIAPSKTPKQLYDTARSLIPGELGSFDLGHVKALLNLAIFSITQSLTETAWLLVGCASRVFEAYDASSLAHTARRTHVFGGCFVLDSMLALQLGRRPYFSKANVEQLGRIDEDGLEEWQPWSGSSHIQQSRTPLLAFSSFRHLLDILDVLVSVETTPLSAPLVQEAVQRISDWKVLAPPKLDYLRSEPASTPLTPPAVLLQLTHYCAILALSPSQSRLLSILELLERASDQIGFASLPAILQCLIKSITKHSTTLLPDLPTRTRLQKLQQEIDRTWSCSIPSLSSPQPHQLRPSTSTLQMLTPDSLQHRVHTRKPSANPQTPSLLTATTPSSTTTTLAPFLRTSQQQQPGGVEDGYPDLPNDLEGFFDDLATLDSGANKEARPQFMQNLGFAPDANMADLFSEFIPTQSSAFMEGELELGGFGFYGGG